MRDLRAQKSRTVAYEGARSLGHELDVFEVMPDGETRRSSCRICGRTAWVAADGTSGGEALSHDCFRESQNDELWSVLFVQDKTGEKYQIVGNADATGHGTLIAEGEDETLIQQIVREHNLTLTRWTTSKWARTSPYQNCRLGFAEMDRLTDIWAVQDAKEKDRTDRILDAHRWAVKKDPRHGHTLEACQTAQGRGYDAITPYPCYYLCDKDCVQHGGCSEFKDSATVKAIA